MVRIPLLKASIGRLSRRREPLLPGTKNAARDPQQPAHLCYGLATGQRLDGTKPHLMGCERLFLSIALHGDLSQLLAQAT